MTKVDVFSGFLGAGKTTLLKKLIGGAYGDEKLVLLENEFGEVGIDQAFMKDTGIEISEINSGCICCSMAGDFVGQLKTLIEWETPDRILIEPSGVAKLSDIRRSVEQVKQACRDDEVILNSLVVVVDAKHYQMYVENFGEFYLDQIANARCIVLSRTEELAEAELEACAAQMRKYNRDAALITTPWGLLKPEQMRAAVEHSDTLADGLRALLQEQGHIRGEEPCGHEHHGHHCHEHGSCGCGHAHSAGEVFVSWGTETPRGFTREELMEIGESLNNTASLGQVLRAKGNVAAREGGWYAFDYTPGEFEMRSGGPEVTGRISVIGTELRREALETLFGISRR